MKRFCQMAIWGAIVKPSSKDMSCKFIFNQLASSLLTATGDLTSTLGSTLGNTLGVLGGKKNAAGNTPVKSGVQSIQSNKQTDKKSATSNNRGNGGLLGIL